MIIVCKSKLWYISRLSRVIRFHARVPNLKGTFQDGRLSFLFIFDSLFGLCGIDGKRKKQGIRLETHCSLPLAPVVLHRLDAKATVEVFFKAFGDSYSPYCPNVGVYRLSDRYACAYAGRR